MDQVRRYRIHVKGHITEAEVNQDSPRQVLVTPLEREITLLAAQTDQAGLIGLLRHIHARGFVLLSMDAID